MPRIIHEAIVAPPRRPYVWARMTVRKLDRLIGEIEGAKALLDQAEKIAEDGFDRPLTMLAQWCRYGAGEAGGDAQGLIWELESDLNNANRDHPRHLPLRWLRDALANYVEHGSNLRRYVTNAPEAAQPHSDDHRRAAELLSHAEAGAAEYGFKPGDPANVEDADYVAAMTALKALRKFVRAAREGETILRETADKFREFPDLEWQQHKYRPRHEDVETMWHATAFADDIAKRGFQAERPMDRRGVGSFGAQPEISFTFDRAYANTILRVMRELWMIGHGQIALKDVLRWFAAERFPPERLKQHLRDALAKNAPEEQTAHLYGSWLWLSKSGIENPAFTNTVSTMDMLKDRAYTDLGIIEAEVRMDAKDSSYHHAEAEFRVRPSAVVSVRRVA